jgi:TRAP-type C4-dicarboxylate transport system substrate-binding protein
VFLDKLPPDLRKIVIDQGKETQLKTNKWEQEFSKSLEKSWAEMGGNMHRLPADELAKMGTLLNTVADDVSKDQPAVVDMLKKVRAVAAKH